jgi:hypothetical protein
MQNNEARGGNWAGDITFSNNTSNPLNTNFAFANAALGVFSQYTETDKYRVDAEPPVVERMVPAGHVAGDGRASPRLRRAVPVVLAVQPARRPGRELRSVEVRSRSRRRGCTSRRSSTARASRSIRSPGSR